jgi:hypothetical protein
VATWRPARPSDRLSRPQEVMPPATAHGGRQASRVDIGNVGSTAPKSAQS